MNQIITMQQQVNQLQSPYHPTRKDKKDKLRIFSPIILFHEHTYKTDTDEACVRICQNDEYKHNLINTRKKRVNEMLLEHSSFWKAVIENCRELNRDHRQSQPIQLSTTIYSHSQDQSIDSLVKPKRRRGNLPKAVTALLKDWLSRHRKHPYPTEEEKLSLAKETKLSLQQISNWFINARRRHLPHLLENDFSGNSRSQRSPELDIYYEADSTDSDNGRLNMRNHKCARINKAGGGIKKPYSRRKATP
jgi:hypothetical protein